MADFPNVESIGWIFDSEVKDVRHEPRGLRDASPEARVLRDYEKLLKERRNKMTQTFRHMLKQNSIASEKSLSSEEKQVKQDSSSSKESRENSYSSEKKERQKSLMRRLFGSLFEEVEVDLPSLESGARGSNEPVKKTETPIQSSSSSSSVDNRSVLLPVESAPVSVNSSRSRESSRGSAERREASESLASSQTIEYVDEEDLPINISSSSSNRTVIYIISGSSRRSRPITISSGSR